MTIKLSFQDPAAFPAPLLAVFAVDISTGADAEPHPVLLSTSDAITQAADQWIASGEFKAGLAETLLLHAPAGVKAERVLVVGLGKAKSLSIHEVRKGAGVVVRFAKPRSLREVAITFPEDKAYSDEHMDALPCDGTARALVEGALLADFDIDTYRSDRKDLSVRSVGLVVNELDAKAQAEMQRGFEEGVALAESQNFARALVNEPGNVLTPTELGKRAAAMCEEVGLACEVHSWDKIRELKMGALAAVAQGSEEAPALIVARYEPKEAKGDGPVLALVGKGITFDTGGISIKPADNMDKMKYDMAGAAAMLGAMRAIALLKPEVRVICVVCSAENMPDGKAFKPGDVITAMSGKTIEILNTDAEGRLVLADGLHYAKTLGATHLINAATLTGAVGVALGLLNAGLFSNCDVTTEKFLSGLQASGEKFWRLPCTDDYRDQIKSQIADIQNTGNSRYGGATTAAMFLKEFAGETPWIHLDIAGMAWVDEQKPWQAKGPSGVAVRSIFEWVRSYAEWSRRAGWYARLNMWMKSWVVMGAGLCALPVGLLANAQAKTPDATEAALVKAVDSETPAAVALLETLVNINSGTMNTAGVVKVKDQLEPQIQALGFKTTWNPMESVKRAGDLVAEHPCPAGKGKCGQHILLIGHMDTVFEANSAFQAYAIVPGTQGRIATGPGVSDMKGGLVVMLTALKAMQAAGVLDRSEITMVLDGDEESHGRPSSVSRRDLIAAGKRSDVALEFENAARTGGLEGRDAVRIGRRSSIAWRLETTGRSGHSSVVFGERLGFGAVYELARILDQFRTELREPGLTFNVGLVLGGATAAINATHTGGFATGKSNVIPAQAVATGDIRTLNDEQTVRVQKKMEAIVHDHLAKTGAVIEFEDGYPAMGVTPASEALLAKLQGVNETLGFGTEEVTDPVLGGAGDIAFVAPYLPGLVGVGAMGTGSHAEGETIFLDSIPKQAKRMAVLMYRLGLEAKAK